MSDLAIVIDDEKRVGQEDKPRDNIGRKAGADGIETRIDGCVSSEGWHVQQGKTCRGRSQSPVVWIAEELETEPSKPIDKTARGEVTSHRAVTTVNALWPRKV